MDLGEVVNQVSLHCLKMKQKIWVFGYVQIMQKQYLASTMSFIKSKCNHKNVVDRIMVGNTKLTAQKQRILWLMTIWNCIVEGVEDLNIDKWLQFLGREDHLKEKYVAASGSEFYNTYILWSYIIIIYTNWVNRPNFTRMINKIH